MPETEIRNLSGVHRFWRILGIVVSVCLALYALPILAAHWLLFLAFPFVSFTFTDPPDFIFAGLIVFTLTALAVRHSRRPYPPGWVKTASAAAAVLAVAAPLVPMAALYLLALRGQDLIGHWPQPMHDDPKHIGLDDPTYQMFRAAVIYGSCFTGWGLATWGALLVHLRGSLTTRRMLWLIGIFLLAWLLFVADPGRRFEWWLD
ncbi:MAG: hypothetical protein ACJ76J_21515 [Thermoanaerobaculia bacterium]